MFEDELEIIHSFVRGIPTHSLSQFTLPGGGGPLLPFGDGYSQERRHRSDA